MHTTQKPKLVPNKAILYKELFLRLKAHYVFNLSLFSYAHGLFHAGSLGANDAPKCRVYSSIFRMNREHPTARDPAMI
jgi:hypothetical protein